MSNQLRILFVSCHLPYPQVEHAGGMILYQFIRHLSTRHEVSLISFVRSEAEREQAAKLEPYCQTVRTILHPGALVESDFRLRPIARVWNLVAEREPFQVRQFHHPAMVQAIRETMIQDPFDIVQIEFTATGQYLNTIAHPRTVLNEYDVSFVPFRRRFEQTQNPLGRLYLWAQWRKMLRFELDVCRRVGRVLVPSEQGRQALLSHLPDLGVTIVPFGISLDSLPVYTREENKTPHLLFLGAMGRPPNVAAMEYFYHQVFPRIRQQVPEVRLTIAGSNPPPQIQALTADEAVEVTGYVADRAPYYARCAVFVAPMLTGGGMIIKVLDALAMGCAVVTTSVGNEGVAAPPGEALLVADSAQEFADSVLALLRDPDRRRQLGQAGRQFVEAQYSWPSIISRLETVYHELMEESFCR
jgi:glycosyltransferase involved in cell wall biosynthesis